MKVNGTGGIDPISIYTSQMKKKNTVAKEQAGGQVHADTVEISPEAREMQGYKQLLDKLPDVREDLVTSLKQKIADGSYRPDSEKIARGILEERLLDKVK